MSSDQANPSTFKTAPSEDVWLVMPTANRHNCQRTLPAWRDMGYRIALLQDTARFETCADTVLETDEYRGWPWAINTLCRQAVPESCRLMVAAGDDMLPVPRRHATEIAAEFYERFPDGFGVMQPTGDPFLASDTYCGSPWFGRAWQRCAFGGRGPIPTGYRHNWADMELHWAARGMGVLWSRPDLTQPHEHHTRDAGTPPPEYWTRSATGYDQADCERFIERAWSGFPGCDPLGEPGRYSPDEFRRDYRSIAEIHLHRATGRCAWDARRRAAEAMSLCMDRGWRRIAVYGNGAHTDAVWEVLCGSPVGVSVVIDDHAVPGAARDSVPVVPQNKTMNTAFDAVLVSANSIEDTVLDRAAGLGRPMVRLYGDVSPRIVPSQAAAHLARAR